MRRSPPNRYTTTLKRNKIPHTKKNRNLLAHNAELSRAVVKIDIKVIVQV